MNRLLTKADFEDWCKEIADDWNKRIEAMTPEERKEFIRALNGYAAALGGFPTGGEDGR